jgi:hypothetical protein
MTGDVLTHLRTLQDPEARSCLVQEIAMADAKTYDESVVRALIELLNADEDPDVQQWVTVALRKLRRNTSALDAMWRCFHDVRERESIRVCALHGLGRMGEHLSGDELRALYRDRRDRADDVLLTAAIHWSSRNATEPQILDTFLSLEQQETHHQYPQRFLAAALAAAVRRCARGCLAAGTLDKTWFRRKGAWISLTKLARLASRSSSSLSGRAAPSLGSSTALRMLARTFHSYRAIHSPIFKRSSTSRISSNGRTFALSRPAHTCATRRWCVTSSESSATPARSVVTSSPRPLIHAASCKERLHRPSSSAARAISLRPQAEMHGVRDAPLTDQPAIAEFPAPGDRQCGPTNSIALGRSPR